MPRSSDARCALDAVDRTVRRTVQDRLPAAGRRHVDTQAREGECGVVTGTVLDACVWEWTLTSCDGEWDMESGGI